MRWLLLFSLILCVYCTFKMILCGGLLLHQCISYSKPKLLFCLSFFFLFFFFFSFYFFFALNTSAFLFTCFLEMVRLTEQVLVG